MAGSVQVDTRESARVSFDPASHGYAISPLIYGSNHDVGDAPAMDARRLGGNRLSAYNWEIDASHAGKDYRHQNDRWLTDYSKFWKDLAGQPKVEGQAGAVIGFHKESLHRGAYSLVTVPMIDFAAADANGPVEEVDAAPSKRFVRVAASSDGKPMSLDDGAVYADQFVAFLVKEFGTANTPRGIRGYSLDNEPDLWWETHPRIHPKKARVDEVLSRSVATARAIKSIDAHAEVFGPASWGMTGYVSLADAEDWPDVQAKGKFAWFLDAYLDAMRQASEREGKRLLDVLDVHWYTESPKGRDFTPDEVARSSRALYDTHHTEPNWVGQYFNQYLPLIPKLRASIDQRYPGTKIAISEYDWPMTDTVEGGLTQADALGAFGKFGVHFAAYHHRVAEKRDAFVGAAFKLYRNYDGKGSRFPDRGVPLKLDAPETLTAYAAREAGRLHVIVVSIEREKSIEVSIATGADPKSAASWMFDKSGPTVRAGHAPTLQPKDQSVTMTVAPLSAVHVVVQLENAP